jgi:hypothetical protein
MTEAQRWRRIGRWVAEQPVQWSYLLPAHLYLTDTMRKRLSENVSESVGWGLVNPAEYQTYIIMRCELLALEAEEEGA